MNPVQKLHQALTARNIRVSSAGSAGVFRFSCPHHNGERDSVTCSVGGDGRVLLTCHSGGCSAEQIAAAVGLRPADLFATPTPARHEGERRKVDVDGRSLTLHQDKQAAIRAAGYSVSKAAEKSGVTFDPNTPPAFTFDYTTATGEPVFSVCRWHVETPQGRQKELRQIRRVSDGWVVAGPPANEQRPLYRLRELLESDPSQPVYITEGERACDALRAKGFVVVTSSGGSSKASGTDWNTLSNRGVCILPDADGAGEKYAAAVAKILSKLDPPCGVSIGRLTDDAPELPSKSDAVEWLAVRQGETFEQLAARLDSLPDVSDEIMGSAPDGTADDAAAVAAGETCGAGEQLEFRDAWAASFKPQPLRPVLVEGMLRVGEVANFVAATKAGKSWLGLGLLFAVASGNDWLGRRVNPGNVLLVDNELHPETLQNRLFEVGRALQLGPEARKHRFDYLTLRGNWKDFPAVNELVRSRYKKGELSLILCDAKYRFFGGELEENDNGSQTVFHNMADRFAAEMDCAIAFVHHATKGSQAEKSVVDMGSGGGAQARAVDAHIVLRPHSLDGHAVMEAAVRSFPSVEPSTIRFDWPIWSTVSGVAPEVARSGSGRESRKEMTSKLKAELATCGGEWLTLSKLAERLGTQAGRATFRQAIRELRDSGEVEFRDDFKAPRRKEPVEAIRQKVEI